MPNFFARKSRIFDLLKTSGMRSLIVLLLGMCSFRSAIADWNDVPSGSMKPTILEGDRVFVNKLAYDLKVPFTEIHLAEWANPARGDIVVFYGPDDGVRLIKRVVGLPGDRLTMVGNQLYINGQAVEHADDVKLVSTDYKKENPLGGVLAEERLGKHEHPIAVQSWSEAMRDFPGGVTVPAGHYFMMGDNRDDSRDSRWFGFVDRKLIVGQALAVALSVNPSDSYKPRWQRFLSPLP